MKQLFKFVTIMGAISMLSTWILALCGKLTGYDTFTTIGIITLISLVLWLFGPWDDN